MSNQNITSQQLQELINMQSNELNQQDDEMKMFANKVANELSNPNELININEQHIIDQVVPTQHILNQAVPTQHIRTQPVLNQVEKQSLLDRITNSLPNNLHSPLLVTIIFFVLSNPLVLRYLKKYLTFFVNNDNWTISGLLVISILAGSLFYISQLLIDKI